MWLDIIIKTFYMVGQHLECSVTLPNLMAISLQIVELWGVGGFPPPGLTDFKKPGINRVKLKELNFENMDLFSRNTIFIWPF